MIGIVYKDVVSDILGKVQIRPMFLVYFRGVVCSGRLRVKVEDVL